MFEILEFAFDVTIVHGPCKRHAGCTEYSVVPNDLKRYGYWRHSAGPNLDSGEITMEMLQACIDKENGH
jgi:hypothetical protein